MYTAGEKIPNFAFFPPIICIFPLFGAAVDGATVHLCAAVKLDPLKKKDYINR